MQSFEIFKEVHDFFGDEGLSVSTFGMAPNELKRFVHPRRKQNLKNASKSPFVHTRPNRNIEILGDKGDEFLEAGSNSNIDVFLELLLGGEPKLIT